uniref:15-cis-phytoene synthase n=1 Tax=Gossypium raimondii TaxID=29730 RepID=A0A0D2UDH3_GOSRA|nr:hypothetical protein B456_010G126900 [Gossypium raimondii]
MCITLSLSSKPCIGVCNGSLQSPKSMVTTARTEVITAPKRPNTFPGLTKQGISDIDLRVQEVVRRQSWTNSLVGEVNCRKPRFEPMFIDDAYDKCRNICAEYAKTFYLGTLLMTKERQKAIWAIYVWCRRTDELVDGLNAEYMSPAVLERWEERLQDIFEGRPYDMLDAALSDTVCNFPLDTKPFRDMIEGMRMDTRKSRYESFQELYLYCYYVAGTVGLMSVPVMGIAPESSASAYTIYNAALYLGIGNQLTNILRDVGEDALRGRVYLPQDELAQFGLTDKDVFSRKVWSSLMLYRKILDAIEDNDYDNLTKRAYVGRTKKLLTLPLAYTRALSKPSLYLR